MERVFDNVRVDNIAAAADVGCTTVFDHFPRKEDIFFDRDDESRAEVREAFFNRPPGISPVKSLRLLAHRAVDESGPYAEFSARTLEFVEAVERSKTLKARARTIRDELVQLVATSFADAVGGDSDGLTRPV